MNELRGTMKHRFQQQFQQNSLLKAFLHMHWQQYHKIRQKHFWVSLWSKWDIVGKLELWFKGFRIIRKQLNSIALHIPVVPAKCLLAVNECLFWCAHHCWSCSTDTVMDAMTELCANSNNTMFANIETNPWQSRYGKIPCFPCYNFYTFMKQQNASAEELFTFQLCLDSFFKRFSYC